MDTDKRRLRGLNKLCPVFICGLLLLSGCAIDRPQQTKGYFGPTLPLTELVEKINQNNQRLPTLWTRYDFDASFLDDQKRTITLNGGNGILMYRSPQSLFLTGDKAGAGRIFELGSNDDRFWLIVGDKVDTMWWGDYSKINTIDDADIPIRPDLIVEVLGIGAIDTDFTHEPVPVMRFNNDADAYMLVWNLRLPDRWVAQREVWYDRATLLPRNVLLFDEHGRVVLRAFLSNHQPIDIDQPESAKVATRYRLFFPVSGAKMDLQFEQERGLRMRLKKGNVPNESSFTFPAEVRTSKVIAIHEQSSR